MTKKLNLYALDKNKNDLLSAIETEKYKSKEDYFYCPNCLGKMGIRKGLKNTHHFYHKTDVCSFESYLHKAGKIILFNILSELKKNKESNITFNNCDSITLIKSEIFPNNFFESSLENDLNRLVVVLFKYLTSSDKRVINDFLTKIKETKDKKLIQDFIDFHIYLKEEIDNKLVFDRYKEFTLFKHNYSSFKGGLIGDYQILNKPYSNTEIQFIKNEIRSKKNSWNSIKKSNRLSDNISFLNKKINFRYREDHLYNIYVENISLLDYFRGRLNNESLQKILNLFYNPIFSTKSKIIKKDVEIIAHSIENIYLDNKKYKGFLADVLVELNNADPLFFEIAVTHPCSEEKINSGINIIEINIKNINDLEYLKNMKFKELLINCYNYI